MPSWITAVALGTASGVLIVGAARFPLLGWPALAPLGLVALWCSPGQAAVAGALAGALAMAANHLSPTFRMFLALGSTLGAVNGALAMAGAAWLMAHLE